MPDVTEAETEELSEIQKYLAKNAEERSAPVSGIFYAIAPIVILVLAAFGVHFLVECFF